jgi:hypothetical protein
LKNDVGLFGSLSMAIVGPAQAQDGQCSFKKKRFVQLSSDQAQTSADGHLD